MIQPTLLSRPPVSGPLALAPIGDGGAFDLSFASVVDGAAIAAAVTVPPPVSAVQPAAAPGNALPPAPVVPVDAAPATAAVARASLPDPAMSAPMPGPVTPAAAGSVPTVPVPIDRATAVLAPIAQALAEVVEAVPDDPAPPPPPMPLVQPPRMPLRLRDVAVTGKADERKAANPAKDEASAHEDIGDTAPSDDARTPTTVLPNLPPPAPLPMPVAMHTSASPTVIATMLVQPPVTPSANEPASPSAPPARTATALPAAAISEMPPTPVARALPDRTAPVPMRPRHALEPSEPIIAASPRPVEPAITDAPLPAPARSVAAPSRRIDRVASPIDATIARDPAEPTDTAGPIAPPVAEKSARAPITAAPLAITPAPVPAAAAISLPKPTTPSRSPASVPTADQPVSLPSPERGEPMQARADGVQPAVVTPVAGPVAAAPSIAAAPVANPTEASAPAIERTATPPFARPVALADVAAAALPAPAIVAGATAPAFRMFARAIHDARRDDASVDPVVAAPIAAVEQPRVALPVGDAHGGTLDLGDHRWPHAMVDRIERLRDAASAAADAADTSIRLIPDALGTIDVSVRRDGDTVHVRFTAEQAATRALLTDAQPRLADLAEARGIKLGQASVDGGNAGQGQRQPQTPQSRFDAPAPTRVGGRTEDSTLETTRIA